MKREDFFHDWLVSYLEKRLSKDYKEILANYREKQDHEFQGHHPDLILANHGMVVAIMEVETEETITPEKAEHWTKLAGKGAKLIIMVPAHMKPKVMDLVWKKGLVDKVGVGSYEIVVKV